MCGRFILIDYKCLAPATKRSMECLVYLQTAFYSITSFSPPAQTLISAAGEGTAFLGGGGVVNN